MKKPKKAAVRRGKLHPGIRSVTSTDHKTTPLAAAKPAKAAKPPKAAAKPVSAKEVGDFICKHNPTMAEIEKKFGIAAHPMRAKIHYAKHKLGYAIEAKDGRYQGTPPAGG